MQERAAAAAPMTQEAFSDYHLYTLERKTSVNNNETKQVSLLGATNFPVRKRYIVDGQAFYYRNAQHPGSPIKDVVKVYYEFKNETRRRASACRCPPASCGSIRPTRRAGCSSSARIASITRPKDETLNLKIGHAFDVVAERKQIDFEKISTNVYEMEYEIVLRNHKTTAVTVEVNEPIGGTWKHPPLDTRGHEDRRVGGAIQRAGGIGRRMRPAVSREGDVLKARWGWWGWSGWWVG